MEYTMLLRNNKVTTNDDDLEKFASEQIPAPIGDEAMNDSTIAFNDPGRM
jgi:hypothetical protein